MLGWEENYERATPLPILPTVSGGEHIEGAGLSLSLQVSTLSAGTYHGLHSTEKQVQ
ncbi:MAG: hypothetical protein U0905_14995 [Pirellulales bacterium]